MAITKASFNIRLAVKKIKQGEVIAYPTEAVYGLGCNPVDEEAVLKLLALKKRSTNKGLILIASSIEQLAPYLELTEDIVKRVQASFPSPVTWIIPAQPWVPKWLTGHHCSLAVRITKHPIARQLCEEFDGPLVSTSANISSRPAAKKSWQVSKNLDNNKIFTVAGEVGTLKQATPIIDVLSHQKIR